MNRLRASAAQGMARVTGRPGVCFATSGPGVTNIVTALADAKLDSVPLVCIAWTGAAISDRHGMPFRKWPLSRW